MGSSIPLFEHNARLKTGLPRHVLTQLPTPNTDASRCAEQLGLSQLVIKRDDLTGEVYGGNKVRKLEFLLGKAKADGVKELVTFGYAGSNHALATAIYGRKAGFRVTSVLLPQTNAHYVRRNIRAAVAAGARLVLKPNDKAIASWVAMDQVLGILRSGRRPMIIPAGGSSPLGVVGFVNAGMELAHQIRNGELEKPDRIYLPISSMGSAVGMYLGLRMCNLKIPIHAVRVIEENYTNAKKMKRLLSKTNTYLNDLDPSFEEVEFDESLLVLRNEFVGEGYARFTDTGMDAVRFLKEQLDIPLEGSYSGKAFSCLINDGKAGDLKGKNVLYWNTHNSRDFPSTFPLKNERSIPKAFRRFFDEPVQSMDLTNG